MSASRKVVSFAVPFDKYMEILQEIQETASGLTISDYCYLKVFGKQEVSKFPRPDVDWEHRFNQCNNLRKDLLKDLEKVTTSALLLAEVTELKKGKTISSEVNQIRLKYGLEAL